MKINKKTWLFVALLAGFGLASVQAQTQAELVTSRAAAPVSSNDELVTLQKSVQEAMQNKRWHSAVTLLERLLVLTPSDAFAYGMYGQVLQMLYRYHDGLAAYLKSTELDPKLAAAWAGLCGATNILLSRKAVMPVIDDLGYTMSRIGWVYIKGMLGAGPRRAIHVLPSPSAIAAPKKLQKGD